MEEVVGQVIDLAALADEASAAGKAGALWSVSTADLNANVLRFAAGDGVPEHVNNEVDVLLVVVGGEGAVTLDGHELRVRAGQLMLVPKGARRAIRALGEELVEELVYVTAHRRRMGLMPRRSQRRDR